MSKALVIPGSDFSTNKLTTVTLMDTIPCTGVTLSQDSISFTKLSDTVELTATLTPNNTTDELAWASSDENVATVVDGIVTCVGVGTATITASCGEITATCSVSSMITVNANTAYTAENGYTFYDTTHDYVRKRSSSAYGRLYYGSTDLLSGYKAFWGEGIEGYAIPIPNGTNKITVKVPSGFSKAVTIFALDTNTKSSATGTAGNCAKAVKIVTGTYDASYEQTMTLSNEGANGIVFGMECQSSGDATLITGDVTVTFSKEST